MDGSMTKASSMAGWWRQRFTPRARAARVEDQLLRRSPFASPGATNAGGQAQVESGKARRRGGRYASSGRSPSPVICRAALVHVPGKKFFQALDSRNRYAILYRLHDAKKAERASGGAEVRSDAEAANPA